MRAIIETGGKQYKVAVGDVINVEKLTVDAGQGYVFDRVLCVLDGDNTVFGKPLVSGVTVNATVMSSGKGRKLIVFKYKSKKGYRRKKGHRQPYTQLKISAINQ